MVLTSGTRLGPYEIQSPLGAGGMGEVYRAKDTRLDRNVAVKVLASHLSSSPELKQRMEREARAISSLNHPNICHLYDIGSQDGTDYLVMEFLEGETLAERLRKGALPLTEIYKIAIAVAEALAVAHRSGIVHRDLKPGNVMLTQGGAKLMDFGLAKPLGAQAAAPGSGTAPPSFTAAATLSGPSPLTPLTTAGSIIGTIQYMSPEQIEGKEADARSDIFALGAVLYEMTTGKRPFSGKSQISLASSILESDPQPICALKPSAPPAFEHVITTCLQKNPEDRFQTAHDIKLELQWIAADKSSPSVAAAPSATAPRRERLRWVATIVAAIVLGAAAGILIYHPSQTAPTIRAAINPPGNATLALVGDFAGPPVLSPDGTSIAFVAIGSDGKNMIWVRPLNTPEAHMLAGTEAATFPFWSADSRSLGFFAGGKLKTIDLNGGSPLVVCDAAFGRGGTWGEGGTILFAPEALAPIVRVSASGGTPVPITKFDPAQPTSNRWPLLLPDGKHFLYLYIAARDPATDAVYYSSLDGRETRKLVSSQSNAIYAGGFLLFMRGGQLMAQSFDPAKGTLSGEIQNLASGVMEDASTWHMDASASNNELLIFSNGGTGDQQLVWVDRNGKQIGTVAKKVANLISARLSPQADRVALEIDNGAGNHDIWVYDIARGVQTRLTFGPVENDDPIWSPDGKWIIYTAVESNVHTKLYRKPSDGSGAAELLISDDQVAYASDVSRDGKSLLYARGPSANYWEIWSLPLEGERKPSLVVPHTTNSFANEGHLSPDGRWLVYVSGESGNPEVYVVAFRGGQGKWQVSTNGGFQPQWSRDGKELYYFNQATRSVFSVPVKEIGGGLQFGVAQPLASNATSNQLGFYDVTPDGKKILLNLVSQQVSQSVTVMTNFSAGLKR
jgi:serine/threonine protein kinase/Tol biopolymer transport system component